MRLHCSKVPWSPPRSVALSLSSFPAFKSRPVWRLTFLQEAAYNMVWFVVVWLLQQVVPIPFSFQIPGPRPHALQLRSLKKTLLHAVTGQPEFIRICNRAHGVHDDVLLAKVYCFLLQCRIIYFLFSVCPVHRLIQKTQDISCRALAAAVCASRLNRLVPCDSRSNRCRKC